MGNKKVYKQFKLTTVDDYIFYLGYIMNDIQNGIVKYKRYKKELDNILKEYIERGEKKISTEKYQDINDKLLCTSHLLLKVCAEEQDVSYSYRKFRRLIEKSKLIEDWEPLDKTIQEYLEEFLQVRNWSFHNPESLINASIEVQSKDIPEEQKNQIKPNKNPEIYVNYYNYLDIAYLISLSIHTNRRLEMFSKVFQQVKKDYSKLIGSSVRIYMNYIDEPLKFLDERGMAIELSMKMQRGKYNGKIEDVQDLFDL